MTDETTCPECRGTGKDEVMVALNKLGAVALERCGECNGTGQRPKLTSIDDLLTDEQKKELYDDLAKMAKQRRDAEAFSRDWPMH